MTGHNHPNLGGSTANESHDWETLAALDPYWAILTDPAHRFGQWNVEDFFQTGRHEVEAMLAVARDLGRPMHWESALDFGCGVGRLTRVLAQHFDRCIGVDVSDTMVELARRLNRASRGCVFTTNHGPDLGAFDDGTFDLVCSRLTLQHLSGRSAIYRFLEEFIRVMKPDGLLVFQLPAHIPWRHRVQPRRRLYALLRRSGVADALLYRRLGLSPMRMNFVPEREIARVIDGSGGRILKRASDAVDPILSYQYYVAKREATG